MTKLESPEEFARELAKQARVDKPWGHGEHDEHGVIAMIEVRDAAVKLEAFRRSRGAVPSSTPVAEAERLIVELAVEYIDDCGKLWQLEEAVDALLALRAERKTDGL